MSSMFSIPAEDSSSVAGFGPLQPTANKVTNRSSSPKYLAINRVLSKKGDLGRTDLAQVRLV